MRSGIRPDPTAPVDEDLLLVARCAGRRCSALRDLSPHTDSATLLHDAVSRRPKAVLVSTPCLGACDQASVTAVGPAVAGSGSRLLWLARPAMFGLTDRPDRAQALADWIAGWSHCSDQRGRTPPP